MSLLTTTARHQGCTALCQCRPGDVTPSSLPGRILLTYPLASSNLMGYNLYIGLVQYFEQYLRNLSDVRHRKHGDWN